MCLAIPAKIVALNGEEAVVEMDGVRRTAVVSLVKDPQIGDYVLLHAGFAIRKWSEEDVREYNEIMQIGSQETGDRIQNPDSG
ncbi:MAG: HypC/HybG/HupF family hydrogenase formation chaperone [Kiritimatiellia bacterium]|jgi:hydrogenase expression/formation protein HypC